MHMDLRQAYSILQVEFKSSFPKATKAYRKLALKFHPDKCKDDNAHERFNEIQKAYDYLKKNPIKNEDGLSSDSHAEEQPQQPEPNEISITLTLSEIFTGCTRSEKIVIKVINSSGIEKLETKELKVNIKPGSIAGTRITIEKEGDRYHGKIPANVVVVISEEPHPKFKRIRFDLEYTARLTTEQACSRQVTVPTLNNKKLKLTINQVITQSTVERVKEKGLPIPNGNGKRGDLIIKFDIIYEKDMKQDPPIEKDLYIELEQILTGITKKVQITRSIIDPMTGAEQLEKKILEIHIPPGIESGWRHSFPKTGDQKPETIPADINFTVRQKIHNHFIRYGANVKYNALISESEAKDGIELSIPTLEGKPILFHFQNGMELTKVFQGKGLPIAVNAKKHGDLTVNFKVSDEFVDSPIEHDLPLSLQQILNGCTKKLKITRKIVNRDQVETTEKQTITIDVKPGLESGTRFVFPRMGDQYPGRIPANIIFNTTNKQNETFKRKGANIEYFVKITKSQLSSGESLKIPSLEGDLLEFSPDGIGMSKISVKRFKNRGLPLSKKPSKRGDLVVYFEIVDEIQDLPIELDLPLTDEQMRNGLTKKMKINKLVFDSHENQIEVDKILEIDVKPGTKVGQRFIFPQEGDQKAGTISADIVFTVKRKVARIQQSAVKDPAIEIKLPISLEEILRETIKKRKITRKIFDQNGNEQIEVKIIEIKVNPGAEEGTQFVFPNLGDTHPGRISADIVFTVSLLEHPTFKRIKNDIEYTLKLTTKEAILGGQFMVPTLEQPINRHFDGGIMPDSVVRIPNLGLPFKNNPNKRGDLLVKFDIIFGNL